MSTLVCYPDSRSLTIVSVALFPGELNVLTATIRSWQDGPGIADRHAQRGAERLVYVTCVIARNGRGGAYDQDALLRCWCGW